MDTLEKLRQRGLIQDSTAFDPENNPILKLGRASLAAATAQIEGKDLHDTVTAIKQQLQPQAPEAPSGEELFKMVMREKFPQAQVGLEAWKSLVGRERVASKIPEKLGGLATEAAVDVSNLLPAKLAMGPLAAVAGSMKPAIKSSAVLAEKGALGFYSKLEDLILNKMGKSATPEQILSIAKEAKAEEVAHSGLEEFLKGKEKVSREDVLSRLAESRPKLEEVIKGGAKASLDSTSPYYQIPQVRKIMESDQGFAGIEMTLANDGDAYRALSKKFPVLMSKENWAEIITNDVFLNARNKQFQPTKFANYVEPGGTNYRETLITLPSNVKSPERLNELYAIADKRALTEAESAEMQALETIEFQPKQSGLFVSNHWDEPNVLAHARTNERVDTSGNKLFHIEEIQSDWHQQGRQRGYKGQPVTLEEAKNYFGISDKKWNELSAAQKQAYVDEINDIGSISSKRVPDAPFKKSWHELTAKKMIQDAVASGADRMSWTPGALQAERYALSKQVKEIEYVQDKDGYRLDITAIDGNGVDLPKDRYSANELPGVVGKEIAEKIINNEGSDSALYRKYGGKTLQGVDLKIGGEGMKGFYDKILPDFLRKLGKKYGAEVGETTIKTGDKEIKVPYLQLTKELKDAVMKEGLPLFTAGAVGLPTLINQMRQAQDDRSSRK